MIFSPHTTQHSSKVQIMAFIMNINFKFWYFLHLSNVLYIKGQIHNVHKSYCHPVRLTEGFNNVFSFSSLDISTFKLQIKVKFFHMQQSRV